MADRFCKDCKFPKIGQTSTKKLVMFCRAPGQSQQILNHYKCSCGKFAPRVPYQLPDVNLNSTK